MAGEKQQNERIEATKTVGPRRWLLNRNHYDGSRLYHRGDVVTLPADKQAPRSATLLEPTDDAKAVQKAQAESIAMGKTQRGPAPRHDSQFNRK